MTRGDANIVKRLRLFPNIFYTVKPLQTAEDKKVLIQSANELLNFALGENLSQEIERAITQESPGQWRYGKYLVEFEKEVWPTGKGYELNFLIRDPQFNKGK